MNNLYEVGMLVTLRDDLPEEVHKVLDYVIAGKESDGLELPASDGALFPLRNVPRKEWAYLINDPRAYPEDQKLGVGYGVISKAGQLVFRGIIRENSFWNIWQKFANWLFSITYSGGLVGYYCILDDSILGAIEFFVDGDSVRIFELENSSQFKEELGALRKQIMSIVENIDN
jgi:hypothetical protein